MGLWRCPRGPYEAHDDGNPALFNLWVGFLLHLGSYHCELVCYGLDKQLHHVGYYETGTGPPFSDQASS
jgi:hypothetical protein